MCGEIFVLYVNVGGQSFAKISYNNTNKKKFFLFITVEALCNLDLLIIEEKSELEGCPDKGDMNQMWSTVTWSNIQSNRWIINIRTST